MSDTKRLATLLSIEESHSKLQTDNLALMLRIAELDEQLSQPVLNAGNKEQARCREEGDPCDLEAENESLIDRVAALLDENIRRQEESNQLRGRIAELEDQLNRPVLKTEWQQAQERIAELEADYRRQGNTVVEQSLRIAELEAQLAEAQKDAARYRWLRDVGDKFADSLTSRWMMDATRVDEVIDAAMESE